MYGFLYWAVAFHNAIRNNAQSCREYAQVKLDLAGAHSP